MKKRWSSCKVVSIVLFSFLLLFIEPLMAQFPDSLALFIVADAAYPNIAESLIVSRLEEMEFSVELIGQNDVSDGAANGVSLVLISATVTSGTVADNMPGLIDLPVPVINWEPFLYDAQGFQAADGGEFNTTTIQIINGDHPLAAGLPEDWVTISNTLKGITYGMPEGDVDIIAVNIEDETQVVLFGYEKGAAMAVGTAPERRVGTFLLYDVADDMTEEGWMLFEAAVSWAMTYSDTTSPSKSVTLLSPNGGETWQAGSTQTIRWSSQNVSNVKLEYSTNSGGIWTTIQWSYSASTGQYNWTVPEVNSTHCLVRISDVSKASVSDQSNNYFIINDNMDGDILQIAYTNTPPIIDGGSDDIWSGVNSVALQKSCIEWPAPDDPLDASANFKTLWDEDYLYFFIHIQDDYISTEDFFCFNNDGICFYFDGDNSRMSGEYDFFDDLQLFINYVWSTTEQIIVYNPGDFFDPTEIEFVNSEHDYGWDCEVAIPLYALDIWPEPDYEFGFDIQFNDNDGNGDRDHVLKWWSESDDSWFDPSLFGTAVLVDATGPIENPSVTLLAPNGGETWAAGSSQTIGWSSEDVNQVKLEYSTNGGSSWNTIQENLLASTGQYNWTVPEVNSTSCLVRISDMSDAGVSDQSNQVFFILQSASLTLLSPNGGETWAAGGVQTVQWTSENVSQVKIEYSINGGSTWNNIRSSLTASTGSYAWTVPSVSSQNCLVRISDVGNFSVSDMSDAPFSIIQNEITLEYPHGEDELQSGNIVEIQWQSSGVANVNLFVSYNNGASWDTIAAAIPSTGIFSWTVPYIATKQGKVRIEDAANTTCDDMSANAFTIRIFVSSVYEAEGIPENFRLYQNYPNPFNGETEIVYGLPGASEVILQIYNVEGKCVRTLGEGFQGEGYHGEKWDGKDASGNTLSSGIYLYRLEAKSANHSFSESRKMFLVK